MRGTKTIAMGEFVPGGGSYPTGTALAPTISTTTGYDEMTTTGMDESTKMLITNIVGVSLGVFLLIAVGIIVWKRYPGNFQLQIFALWAINVFCCNFLSNDVVKIHFGV